MDQNSLQSLYQVVLDRKENPIEESYTCYLFSQGLDKILKKCGEECAETIIAAKNGVQADTENEICDLLYHLIVLMVQEHIPLEHIFSILKERSQKIGNLKKPHQSDLNSRYSHLPGLSIKVGFPLLWRASHDRIKPAIEYQRRSWKE